MHKQIKPLDLHQPCFMASIFYFVLIYCLVTLTKQDYQVYEAGFIGQVHKAIKSLNWSNWIYKLKLWCFCSFYTHCFVVQVSNFHSSTPSDIEHHHLMCAPVMPYKTEINGASAWGMREEGGEEGNRGWTVLFCSSLALLQEARRFLPQPLWVTEGLMCWGFQEKQ